MVTNGEKDRDNLQLHLSYITIFFHLANKLCEGISKILTRFISSNVKQIYIHILLA
jgi:hypothetical protein